MGQYERAIKHYKVLANVDNEPNTYLLIKEDYLKLKDTVSAISAMEEGFRKYPDTLNVVANLVDLYIRTAKIEDGLKTINTALANNPDKGEFYYWKGRLELNTAGDDKITKSLESYNIAITKNPTLYYVYYDIGFIYYLQGQDLFTRAGEEKDIKYREEMIKIGTENYEKSVPNLEKCLELNVNNLEIKKETLDTLKRVYYKLQMTEKYDEASGMLKNL
jgi:tetratricopeptide (TPR) repeat protein